MIRNPFYRSLTCLMVGIVAFCWIAMHPTDLVAGTLDQATLDKEHIGAVLDYLKKQGFKNVGILPFQVKKGDQDPTFSAAPLALNYPQLLENAMIVRMDPAAFAGLGIIRDATSVVSHAGIDDYLGDEKQFDRLFTLNYTVPWKKDPVKADAFLCGVIEHSMKTGRGKSVKVTITCLDKSGFKKITTGLPKLVQFSAPLDRNLIADLGYSYALSRNAMRKIYEEVDREQSAVAFVQARAMEFPRRDREKNFGSAYTPSNIGGFSFDILYNGTKQEITPLSTEEGGGPLQFKIPTARPGTEIKMMLTRHEKDKWSISEDTLRPKGVVVKVNGYSLWQKETMSPTVCRKWLFLSGKPGESMEFLGFARDTSGDNWFHFKSLTAAEATKEAPGIGSRIGWIDVYVFADRDAEETEAPKPRYEFTSRGIPSMDSTSPTTFAGYQAAVMKINQMKQNTAVVAKSPGGLIMHEVVPTPGPEIGTAKGLKHPQEIAHLAIRYWTGKEKKVPKLIISE